MHGIKLAKEIDTRQCGHNSYRDLVSLIRLTPRREDNMSASLPTNCANPECREPSIRPIHCSSRKVAIDATDGPPVFSQFITYRCSQCGHTWAVQRHSAQESVWSARDQDVATRGAAASKRGWRGLIQARS